MFEVNKEDIHFGLTKNDDCFEIKLLINARKYETTKNSLRMRPNKIK